MTTPNTNDGGAAFPHAGNSLYFPHFGMTLRDWFAGQALAGILATLPTQYDIKDNAEDAYAYADAMLAERGKGMK